MQKKKKGKKEGGEDRGFQVPVLGGTFAVMPGTQLLGGEGAVFHVSAWLGVINILKDRIFSPGLK